MSLPLTDSPFIPQENILENIAELRKLMSKVTKETTTFLYQAPPEFFTSGATTTKNEADVKADDAGAQVSQTSPAGSLPAKDARQPTQTAQQPHLLPAKTSEQQPQADVQPPRQPAAQQSSAVEQADGSSQPGSALPAPQDAAASTAAAFVPTTPKKKSTKRGVLTSADGTPANLRLVPHHEISASLRAGSSEYKMFQGKVRPCLLVESGLLSSTIASSSISVCSLFRCRFFQRGTRRSTSCPSG